MKRFLTILATLAILAMSITSVSAVEPSNPRDAANLEPAEVGPVTRIDRQQKPDLGTGTESRRYLVRFHDPAVPSYEGDKPGLAATTTRGVEKLDADSAPVVAYRGHLEAAQAEFITRVERTVGHPVDVPFTYQFAVNGMTMVLMPDEARLIAADPAVASIALDIERVLHTDAGPQWQNADALWNAMAELGLPADIKGEGVIIGTIDTGISPGNRSFADVGDDGYDHTNPLDDADPATVDFLGACDPDNAEQFDPLFVCNDKLIGAYNFIGDPPGTPLDSPVDYDGHGTHTASTSGGNVVDDVVVETASGFTTPPFDISGVAPHANVIAYRGCCTLSGLTESIDQAIADEVDVINYSIGSDAPSDLWDDFDALGFLNARAAGIFVATSAGNAGPGDATLGSPADAPWITSVGANSHNRHNGNALTTLTSGDGPLPDIEGKSTTGPLAVSTAIVYAGDIADPDPLCLDATGHEAEFTGKIVICDGGTGRVAKSQRVADQGGVGFVLVNDEADGDSLLADMYVLPGVFISFANGETLKAWLATGTGHEGMIAGTTFTIDDARGDIQTGFSSRGPNRAVDTIAPSVTAPGLDILAGLGADSYTDDIHGFISGTSMSSPHAAGAGALLSQARPTWTPAQQQSALMTTARPTVLNHDGEPATPYAQGSGHIDVGAAAMAGLLFDETFANYNAANPAEGGDPKTLNLPSFADTQCLGTCSWTRTAVAPTGAPAGVTWTATTNADLGMTLGVTLGPDGILSAGESISIGVTANVAGAPSGATLFGRITLTPDNLNVPTVTMPVAVVPTSGILPGSVTIETRRDAGSYPVNDIESIALVDFTGSVAGLVEGTIHAAELNQDPTNGDPYDDLGQVDFYTVEVPAGARRLVAEIVTAEMPDADLFVGTGATPSLATEVCLSATGSAIESCNVDDPSAGTWWVLIQNWADTAAPPDAYTLATAAVPGTSSGNAGVVGPDVAVPGGEPYDIRVTWDELAMEAGDRWYGTAILGSSPATPGNIGSFPVDIHRLADDVTKVASVDTAVAGDTISYDITVQPNSTPEDLTYTIVDTVPAGLTIDAGSVTGGGVVAGQTITWEVAVPTPVGVVGDYVVSTPADSTQCDDWSGFLDLAGLGIPFSPLDGDTVSASAFAAVGPFEHYGQQFASLTVAEDGFITVAGGYGDPSAGDEPWAPQDVPDTARPNGVFAPLWSDLELSVANNRGMRLAQSVGDGFAVIQWDDPFEWTADASVGPSVGKFQAWIYSTVDETRPEVTFEYNSIGALPGIATIGIENFLGTLATAAVNAADPSAALTAGGTICLDYDGPTFDPITVEYDVMVADNAFTGTYTNAAVHTTDDPYAEPATASDSVAVDGVPNPTPFEDVNGNIFLDDIEWAYQEGITFGCSTDPPLFCPKTPVTREQMASFLVRALDLPAPTGDYFLDDEGSIHEGDINSLFEANITTGCGKFMYCPNLVVPREQMASFLVRGFDIAGPATGDHFTDDEASLHEGDINILFEVGVTTGCGGTNFCPSNPVTREQMVAFIHRASILE